MASRSRKIVRSAKNIQYRRDCDKRRKQLNDDIEFNRLNGIKQLEGYELKKYLEKAKDSDPVIVDGEYIEKKQKIFEERLLSFGLKPDKAKSQAAELVALAKNLSEFNEGKTTEDFLKLIEGTGIECLKLK